MAKSSKAGHRTASAARETADQAWSARALDELLGFPAQHLPDLPLGVSFVLHGLGITHEVSCSTVPGKRPSRSGDVFFDGDELKAIAMGVQAERLWRADIRGYCLRKLHDPAFRVTPHVALDGAQPAGGRPWTLAQVMQRLELQLGAIELVTEPAVAPLRSVGAAA